MGQEQRKSFRWTRKSIQKLKTSNPEAVDEAVFNWFLTMESQNIQLTEPTIQEKAAMFENVQALDG